MSSVLLLPRSDAAEFQSRDGDPSLRIALGEDNPSLNRVLTFVLRRDGHEVVRCESELELRDTIVSALVPDTRGPIDLVISEHSLPRISGLALLAGVRGRDCSLPFILIAANPRVQSEARRLGAVVLVPPPRVSELRRAIRQALDGRTRCFAVGEVRGGDGGDYRAATTSGGLS